MNVENLQTPTWIIGCGDIGLRLARHYQVDRQPVKGIVRSPDSAAKCAQTGIDCLQLDLDTEPLPTRDLFKQGNIFYFAPPPASGRTDPRLERFLNHVADAPRRIVLISTTGVYGDCKGAWVDESSPTHPKAERAVRRLAAEQCLINWARVNQVEYIILRVPGIYAADRLPLARLQQGSPVVNENEAPWTNRIHADDLAQICYQAMQSEHTNTVYNVCDNYPSTMTDYFNQVADAANLPRPPQISMDQAREALSPGMLSYLKESRRISNRKMIDELGIKLRYPSLKEGLKTLDTASKINNA